MTCRSCGGAIPAHAWRNGNRRCKACRKKVPGHQYSTHRKPTKSQRAFAINPASLHPVREVETTSWWLDKDREAFAQIVQTRQFPYSKGIVFLGWSGDA